MNPGQFAEAVLSLQCVPPVTKRLVNKALKKIGDDEFFCEKSAGYLSWAIVNQIDPLICRLDPDSSVRHRIQLVESDEELLNWLVEIGSDPHRPLDFSSAVRRAHLPASTRLVLLQLSFISMPLCKELPDGWRDYTGYVLAEMIALLLSLSAADQLVEVTGKWLELPIECDANEELVAQAIGQGRFASLNDDVGFQRRIASAFATSLVGSGKYDMRWGLLLLANWLGLRPDVLNSPERISDAFRSRPLSELPVKQIAELLDPFCQIARVDDHFSYRMIANLLGYWVCLGPTSCKVPEYVDLALESGPLGKLAEAPSCQAPVIFSFANAMRQRSEWGAEAATCLISSWLRFTSSQCADSAGHNRIFKSKPFNALEPSDQGGILAEFAMSARKVEVYGPDVASSILRTWLLRDNRLKEAYSQLSGLSMSEHSFVEVADGQESPLHTVGRVDNEFREPEFRLDQLPLMVQADVLLTFGMTSMYSAEGSEIAFGFMAAWLGIRSDDSFETIQRRFAQDPLVSLHPHMRSLFLRTFFKICMANRNGRPWRKVTGLALQINLHANSAVALSDAASAAVQRNEGATGRAEYLYCLSRIHSPNSHEAVEAIRTYVSLFGEIARDSQLGVQHRIDALQALTAGRKEAVRIGAAWCDAAASELDEKHRLREWLLWLETIDNRTVELRATIFEDGGDQSTTPVHLDDLPAWPYTDASWETANEPLDFTDTLPGNPLSFEDQKDEVTSAALGYHPSSHDPPEGEESSLDGQLSPLRTSIKSSLLLDSTDETKPVYLRFIFDEEQRLRWIAGQQVDDKLDIIASWQSSPGAETRLEWASAVFDANSETTWHRARGTPRARFPLVKRLVAFARGLQDVPPGHREWKQFTAELAATFHTLRGARPAILHVITAIQEAVASRAYIPPEACQAVEAFLSSSPYKSNVEHSRKQDLDKLIHEFAATFGQECDLSDLLLKLGAERPDLVYSGYGVIWSFPLPLLPTTPGRVLEDEFRSVSATVSVQLYNAQSRLSELGDSFGRPVLMTGAWLEHEERVHASGLARMIASLEEITKKHHVRHFKLGDLPLCNSTNVSQVMQTGGTNVAIVAGHGSEQNCGIALGDNTWWRGAGSSGKDLLIAVSCQVGRLWQESPNDVAGLVAATAACRSVLAARYPIADYEAAYFIVNFVDRYLGEWKRIGKRPGQFYRARLLKQIRRDVRDVESPLSSRVSIGLAYTFDLYGSS